MADIQIAGATYTDVPSILIPKVGGGNAQFYELTGNLAWMGKNPTLISNIYSKEDTLNNTTFASWTPSTTATDIVASATAGTFVADMENYEYYLVWEFGATPSYTGTPTLKAHFLFSRAYLVQNLTKRPSSWANIGDDNFNGNACVSLWTSNFCRYYGTTTGSVTYTWAATYGFYPSLTAATFSSSTSNTPTVTVKTPKISARCSTTYMSTANAKLIDQANSPWFLKGYVYRVEKDSILHGIYEKTVELVNEVEE